VTGSHGTPQEVIGFGMSALGQKQTFAPQKGMSALPLKADIKRYAQNVR
jgi:hypothetical protein